ncbi:MAG: UDP-N-acetylglucosamine 2-epimerase (non-hydrolyzing), partial [Armatimonadetes bacterium]|nr:UDP-N-acetylglucosamine 2-epimerase (non-hydrolyzing) [Armatimonadota bacterium]
FDQLRLPRPDFNLDVGSASHAQQTALVMQRFEPVLEKLGPDLVVVVGDVNSTLACALVCAKQETKVAHVEAGLRSFNRAMPEELNRILVDHLSDLLFAPTETALSNLSNEGVPPERVVKCGDVMYDAALIFGKKAETRSSIVDDLQLEHGHYVLATVHRAENTDDKARLRAILDGLVIVSESLPVVLPLHPRTRAALTSAGLLDRAKKALRIVEPLGYLDLLMLERSAAVVATDSGGMQKEAFFQRTPCVTLRDETEWVELVEAGWNRIQPPTSPEAVAGSILSAVGTSGTELDAYGHGDASRIIARSLQER